MKKTLVLAAPYPAHLPPEFALALVSVFTALGSSGPMIVSLPLTPHSRKDDLATSRQRRAVAMTRRTPRSVPIEGVVAPRWCAESDRRSHGLVPLRWYQPLSFIIALLMLLFFARLVPYGLFRI
jgi:hypothetical protein